MITRKENPAGLGVLPLLALTGGLIAAGSAVLGYFYADKQIGDAAPKPAPAPAPSAPQTAEEFRHWSPETALASDRAAFKTWGLTAFDQAAEYFQKNGRPPEPEPSNGGLYIALFVTAAALLISFKD